MFTLWNKFIFALMQHFENKLSALKQSEHVCLCISDQGIIPISYNQKQPRVVVKYKNKKKHKKDSKRRCQTAQKSNKRTIGNPNSRKSTIVTHKKVKQFR